GELYYLLHDPRTGITNQATAAARGLTQEEIISQAAANSNLFQSSSAVVGDARKPLGRMRNNIEDEEVQKGDRIAGWDGSQIHLMHRILGKPQGTFPPRQMNAPRRSPEVIE